MSEECLVSARRFLEALDKDETMRKLLNGMNACEAVAAFASTKGYSFTGDDLDEALRRKWCELYDVIAPRYCFSEVPSF